MNVAAALIFRLDAFGKLGFIAVILQDRMIAVCKGKLCAGFFEVDAADPVLLGVGNLIGAGGSGFPEYPGLGAGASRAETGKRCAGVRG